MKNRKLVLSIAVFIALLSAFAAGTGVFWQGEGDPVPFLTERGEEVLLHSRGLYHYDSVSYAAQAIGQDIVTLVIGIPLLLVSAYYAARGSLRGRLLLTGTLGYFLYTYASYAFLMAFNQFFLLYVALFSLSLYGFILAMTSFDVASIPARFSASMPRVPAVILFFFLAGFLLLAWLGRIVPGLVAGTTPVGLDNATTLVIQSLDLGVVVPAALACGVLLLRRRPLGYLLATVVLVKGFTMSAALVAMIVMMVAAGVEVAAFEAIVFPIFGLVEAVVTVLMLRSVQAEAPAHKQIATPRVGLAS